MDSSTTAAESRAVEVSRVTKRYAVKTAVDDLSFGVNHGEIFGIIGPNGAGKTTSIRMLMNIIAPDSGTVSVFGEKLSERTKSRLGYLPEERGLYKKQRVIDSIIYLASLKGVDRRTATARADKLLAKVGLQEARGKKIEELSKGMSQLIQFIVTILHEPELIVLDEPFSGLDPVNTELLKDMIHDLRSQGRAIMLSTHQMSQVEELCDRVLMVNRGKAVLYGDLTQIKSRYRGNSVLVDTEGSLAGVPGVTQSVRRKEGIELKLADGTRPQDVFGWLAAQGIAVNRFEITTPSLNEIFISLAGRKSSDE
ncbi:MAG: ATP-binding cassette domain-containing protein [Dehalococcoidia bacterium]|nr:ATP-binding cassette domain-containing protein [Dehalococcoidia bacterium]